VKTLSIALRASIYSSGFILLFGWIALSLRRFDEDVGVTLPPWSDVIGVIVMSIGGGLVLTCLGLFVVWGRGTGAVFDPPQQFVVVGPYRYVRNPMYIGGLILLIGFGFYHRSASIVFSSSMFFLFFHLFVLFYEEPGLEKRFGQGYRDYKKSVKRWIPRWR